MLRHHSLRLPFPEVLVKPEVVVVVVASVAVVAVSGGFVEVSKSSVIISYSQCRPLKWSCIELRKNIANSVP